MAAPPELLDALEPKGEPARQPQRVLLVGAVSGAPPPPGCVRGSLSFGSFAGTREPPAVPAAGVFALTLLGVWPRLALFN